MAEVGYCVKCKAKKEMKDTQNVTMKNGRKAMKGKCTSCGTGSSTSSIDRREIISNTVSLRPKILYVKLPRIERINPGSGKLVYAATANNLNRVKFVLHIHAPNNKTVCADVLAVDDPLGNLREGRLHKKCREYEKPYAPK